MIDHLETLYRFYGEFTGVRVARKHLGWYCKGRPGANAFWQEVARVDSSVEQVRQVKRYFASLAMHSQQAA
jgi:tRNA-dihydrouridine synthase B